MNTTGVTERDDLHSNCSFTLTRLKIAEDAVLKGGVKMAQSQSRQINESISVIHEWRRNICHQQKKNK